MTTLNPRMDGATLREKMDAYVDRSAGPDGCWPWTRGRSTDGYGRVYPPGASRALLAHRVACLMATGDPAEGREVLHSCDNPPCCNPAHLRVGTHAENMAEMTERGRANVSALRLYDDDMVLRVRHLASQGLAQREIATITGLSRSYISRLVRRQRRP